MKRSGFWTILLLTYTALTAQGQTLTTRFLSYKQNESWLAATKALDKATQWAAMQKRFFTRENQNSPIDSIGYAPTIIINGIPFSLPERISETQSKEFAELFNEKSIHEIVILDSISGQWIFCSPFAGAILLRVDKKTERRLWKLLKVNK